jgi:hypothetical protein
MAPSVLNALYLQAGRMADSGDRWIYCAHAVRLLATARKDNMSNELAGWTKEVVARGERRVVVEDFMVDMHTRRGVEMGRDAAHWWDEGARLENRIEAYDPKWGDYLRRLARAKVDATGEEKSPERERG